MLCRLQFDEVCLGKKVSVIIIIIIGDLNNGVHKGSKGVIFAKYVITLPYG